MMRITVDSDMQSRLAQASGLLAICDQSGIVLGYYQPAAPSGRLKDLSPYSDSDIAELSQQKTGRPLADIWKDLESRYGS